MTRHVNNNIKKLIFTKCQAHIVSLNLQSYTFKLSCDFPALYTWKVQSGLGPAKSHPDRLTPGLTEVNSALSVLPLETSRAAPKSSSLS